MVIRTRSILLILSLFICGCAVKLPETPRDELDALYVADSHASKLLAAHAPIFLVRDHQDDFNRIGSPAARSKGPNEHEVYIDTETPVFYTSLKHFKVKGLQFTNLIYRVHFSRTPLPHLTSGKNVGLLVYVTLNANNRPILITTLHTCGCYLAFLPTSDLPKPVWPEDWPQEDQIVSGKKLPSILAAPAPGERLLIDLESETHRVRNISYIDPRDYHEEKLIKTGLQPMADLEKLVLGDRRVSFFETKGFRKGYVKGSRKRLEMLLMSWWAMDLFVGEDKALGPPADTGVDLYTSLKFWNRKRSNIWFFPEFLDYWGWHFDRLNLSDR
jgi:hypothetical protein